MSTHKALMKWGRRDFWKLAIAGGIGAAFFGGASSDGHSYTRWYRIVHQANPSAWVRFHYYTKNGKTIQIPCTFTDGDLKRMGLQELDAAIEKNARSSAEDFWQMCNERGKWPDITTEQDLLAGGAIA